ncbi:hypothetical protein ACFSTC_12665 [Nonomuraea ferruginea]
MTRSCWSCRWNPAGPTPTGGSTPCAAASPSNGGPLVYCAESVGDEPPLAEVAVRPGAPLTEHARGEVVELETEAVLGASPAGPWPYRDRPHGWNGGPAAALRLIPYHRWGNRGPATMRVWLPVAD